MEHRLKIQSGAFFRSKYALMNTPGGEDVYFLDMAAQVIGIADGVGSWSKKGIDAGEYARQLMENAAEAVNGCLPNQVNPKQVIVKAHQATMAEGTSTVCVICFDGHLFRFANLGDSGFLVLRGKRVLYKSSVQQHKFNHPYQIGKMSGKDTVDLAEEGQLVLKRGDVIVAGTDGLWDNLPVEEINSINQNCYRYEPKELATRLGIKALCASKDEKKESPFQRDAMKAGVHHSGGKFDDITVVVAYVVQTGCGQVSNFSSCTRLVCDEDGDTVMVDAY